MKKVFWLMVGLMIFSPGFSVCFGCASGLQSKVELSDGTEVEFKHGLHGLSFEGQRSPYKDPKAVEEKLRGVGDRLSAEDIQVVTDFVVRGLFVKQQTDEQYLKLQNKLKKERNDCPSMINVERKGKWTAYTPTNKLWSEGEGCLQPQCI